MCVCEHVHVCVVSAMPLKDRGGQVSIGLNVMKVRPLKDRGGQVSVGWKVIHTWEMRW